MANDGLNSNTGINSGEAQVFRPFDYSYIDRQEAARQKAAAEKAAQGQKNLSDLSKQLQSLNKLDIFHRDQPIFQQKNKELWDYANKNVRAIKSGDINAKIKIDQMIADLENESALSKNARESYEQANLSLATSGKSSKLRPESSDYINEFASQPGNYGFEPSKLRFNEDVGEYINKELVPIAKMQSEKGKNVTAPDEKGIVYSTKKHEFTLPEAENLVKERVGTNPVLLEQVNYDYNKLPKEEQAQYGDAMTYAAKKFAPNLVIKDNENDVKSIGNHNDFGLRIGNGMAQNEDWTFTGGVHNVPNPYYERLSEGAKKLFKGAKTVEGETIAIDPSKTNTVIKTMPVPDTENPGATRDGQLVSITKYPNGKHEYTYVDKTQGGVYEGEYFTVPEAVVGDKVKNFIGLDPRDLYKSGITKKGGQTITKNKPSGTGGGSGKVKAKTVTQKGITYTWNENTGKYE